MERPFDMIGMQLSELNPQDLEQRIREALTKHPSIVDIEQFDLLYSADDEFIIVSFVVQLIDQQSINVQSIKLP